MFEAWRIGVRVSVLDYASIGLRAISGAFLRSEGDAAKLEARVKSIQSQFLKGGLMVGAGVGVLAMFKKPLEEAAKFQTEVAKFSLFGMGDKVNGQAVAFAKGMNVIGTSATEAMRAVSEAQGVFRESGLSGSASLAGAKLAAPLLAKIDFATAALDDTTKSRMHAQGLDMLRFIEMRGGLSSPAAFNSIANDGWKAIRSSGGNVAWSQLRQFMSTGSVAAQGLSDKALFGEMEPIIGEMKGGAAGHALMTSFSRMEGLQRLMPRIFQNEVLKLGLWDRSKLTFNSQGGIKEMKGNPLVNSSLFSESPFEYYQKMVLPAYTKAGITKPEDIFRENAVLFGNTGGKMFSIMYRQQEQIANSVNAQVKTLGVDASVKQASATLPAKMIAFHSKFANLMLVLGDTVLPLACSALEKLIPLVQGLTTWMQKHQTAVKVFAESLVGLAGLAIVGGTINILAASIRGLSLAAGAARILTVGKTLESGTVIPGVIGMLSKVPALLGTLGTAVMWVGRALLMNPIGLALTAVGLAGIYVYKHWSTIGPYVKKAWNIVMAAFHVGMDWISGIVKTVWTAVQPFRTLIGNTFLSIFDTITFGVKTAFDTVKLIITSLWDFIANSKIGKAIGWVGDKANDVSDAIGHGVANVARTASKWADKENASYAAEHSGKSYARPGERQAIAVTTQINLDGRRVAENTTMHQTKAASRPQTGMSGFDSSQMAAPIGLNGAN